MPSSKTPRRINVEVTEVDIEHAHQNDSYKCVVAQAVARTVPNATNVDVDTQSIRFTVDGTRRIYMTPYAVQGYVIAFDAGDEIEPFTFQLRDPKVKPTVKRTAAGKHAHRKAAAARKAAETQQAKDPESTIDPAEAARAAYAEARLERPGKASTGGSHLMPRVWKRKRRSYGHRLLRINQDEG